MNEELILQKRFQFYNMKIDLMKRREEFLLSELEENEAFDENKFQYVFGEKLKLPEIITNCIKSMQKWIVMMTIRLGILNNNDFYNEEKDEYIPKSGPLYRYKIIDKWKETKLELERRKEEILMEQEMKKMMAGFM